LGGTMKLLSKLLLATALAFTVTAAGAASDKVVLYSSNNVDTLNLIKDAFEKKYPDINISVVRAGSGSLMQRIKAEAKNPMGDIFWSGGLSTINQFEDYQEPYKTPEADKVAPDLKDAKDHWLGTNIHVAILMVNTKQLPKGYEVPKSWKDLADSKWEGLIISPDPAKSGTAYSTLYGLREIVGPETFEKIVKNMVVAGTTAGAYEGPARGEFPVGITMENAASEYKEGGLPNIEIIYPEDGTVTMAEGMFILKDAKNMDAAKKLYDFLASKEAQELLFQKYYRRPARNDIDLSKFSHVPPLDQIKVHDVDQQKSGDERAEFLKQFNDIRASVKK
ncbi:MAG: extracellular solute-binding protein, partial [Burkholderiales bacterium]|nr:extracellular solute-binding protein [Burkholderiales bacterium]